MKINWLKVGTGVTAYLLVFGIYVAFFAYPVEPAKASHINYVLVENKTYSTLPYVVYHVYVRGSVAPGILLVATVRTPFIPDKTYSKVLRSMEGIIENETKKRYHADLDLVLKGEKKVVIAGRETVMDDYDVHLRYFNSYNFLGRPDTIKLYFGAFFCRAHYETVVVAYAAPPYLGDFKQVMEAIKC